MGESGMLMAYFMRPRVTALSTPPEPETREFGTEKLEKWTVEWEMELRDIHAGLETALSHVVVEHGAFFFDPLFRLEVSLFLKV